MGKWTFALNANEADPSSDMGGGGLILGLLPWFFVLLGSFFVLLVFFGIFFVSLGVFIFVFSELTLSLLQVHLGESPLSFVESLLNWGLI